MSHAVPVVWHRETRCWLWSCHSEDARVLRGCSHGIVSSGGAEGQRAASRPHMLTDVSSSRARKAGRASVLQVQQTTVKEKLRGWI